MESASEQTVDATAQLTPKSWKLGCKTKSCVGWSYNALRFKSKADCEQYGRELFDRWTALSAYEAHPCDDEPNFVPRPPQG